MYSIVYLMMRRRRTGQWRWIPVPSTWDGGKEKATWERSEAYL